MDLITFKIFKRRLHFSSKLFLRNYPWYNRPTNHKTPRFHLILWSRNFVPKLSKKCTFPLNSCPRKLNKITVFYAVHAEHMRHLQKIGLHFYGRSKGYSEDNDCLFMDLFVRIERHFLRTSFWCSIIHV